MAWCCEDWKHPSKISQNQDCWWLQEKGTFSVELDPQSVVLFNAFEKTQWVWGSVASNFTREDVPLFNLAISQSLTLTLNLRSCLTIPQYRCGMCHYSGWHTATSFKKSSSESSFINTCLQGRLVTSRAGSFTVWTSIQLRQREWPFNSTILKLLLVQSWGNPETLILYA